MRKRGGEAALPLNKEVISSSSSPAHVRFPCSESALAWDRRALKGASCAFGITQRTSGRGKNELQVIVKRWFKKIYLINSVCLPICCITGDLNRNLSVIFESLRRTYGHQVNVLHSRNGQNMKHSQFSRPMYYP